MASRYPSSCNSSCSDMSLDSVDLNSSRPSNKQRKRERKKENILIFKEQVVKFLTSLDAEEFDISKYPAEYKKQFGEKPLMSGAFLKMLKQIDDVVVLRQVATSQYFMSLRAKNPLSSQQASAGLAQDNVQAQETPNMRVSTPGGTNQCEVKTRTTQQVNSTMTNASALSARNHNPALLKTEIVQVLKNYGKELDINKFKEVYSRFFGKKFNHTGGILELFEASFLKDVLTIRKISSLDFIPLNLTDSANISGNQCLVSLKAQNSLNSQTTQQNTLIQQVPGGAGQGAVQSHLTQQVPGGSTSQTRSNDSTMKDEIIQVLQAHGQEVDISMFGRIYKKILGKKFSVTRKLLPFFESMQDIVTIRKNSSACFISLKLPIKPAIPTQAWSDNSVPPDNVASLAQIMQEETRKVSIETDCTIEPPLKRVRISSNEKAALTSLIADPPQTVRISPALIPHGRNPTRKQINDKALEAIQVLHSNDECVTLIAVKRLMLQSFNRGSLQQLGVFYERDVDALKDLAMLQSKVNLYIESFVMVRSIATVHELGQCLAKLEDKQDFEELKLGPLQKQACIYQHFKTPQDLDPIPAITTVKIMRHLKDFLSKKDLWRSKLVLEDFMEYLLEEYSVSDPYELGIRIRSPGLAISALKRASSHESSTRKDAEDKLKVEMQEEITTYLQKIKTSLYGKHSRNLVDQLTGSGLVDILVKVFDHCNELFSGNSRNKIVQFIKLVTSGKLEKTLFHLALYLGFKELVDPPQDVLDEKKRQEESESETDSSDESSDSEEEEIIRPSKGKVIEEVTKFLTKAQITLDSLSRIEQQVLVNHFSDFKDFHQLGHGTFLQFVTQNKEFKEHLEDIRSTGGAGNLAVDVSQESLLDFINQCGVDKPMELIEELLCEHYNVEKVSQLGHGSVSKLHKQTQQYNTQNGTTSHCVFYQEPLLSTRKQTNKQLDKQTLDHGNKQRSVGLLGWLSEEDVMNCLKSAPLLEDLACWSNWEEVFAPQFGDLKSFIEKKGLLIASKHNTTSLSSDNEQVVALETSPGTLLHITLKSSPSAFQSAAMKGYFVQTAGLLVSLIVSSGGVSKTPLALLASHMRSAFAHLVTRKGEDAVRSECDGISVAAEFAVNCLLRIPFAFSKALAYQMFLEPLDQIIGSTQVPTLLLHHCSTSRQRGHLHKLGVALSIVEWVEDFKCKFTGMEELKTEDTVIPLHLPHVDDDARPVAVVEPLQKLQEVPSEEKDCIDLTLEPSEASEPSDTASSTDSEDELIQDEVEQEEKPELKEEEEEDIKPTQEDLCHSLIEQIRRQEFGIGVELGETESRLVQVQREREGRSLHRLSSELYTKDTHFVLELVQNADDNEYPEELFSQHSDVYPSLCFVLEGDNVIVLNNERGFSEKNIRALCDVGRSTKGKHQYGYIGQKGIGFKSVFRVSDCPEVHSNGYHIKFDAQSGPIGYILPHWVVEDQDEQEKKQDDTYNSWMTRIVLPLKEDQKMSLSARFRDVHPSLLLFLHRLRNITIIDKVHNSKESMIRRDERDGIIQLKHSRGNESWLVVKKQLQASQLRSDIELTELALAFPVSALEAALKNKIKPAHIHQTLLQRHVFAYLPLRSYGFRFIIQGDFDVPSSREDVDSDSAWNQWLREEIPHLFLEALQNFKSHQHFPGLSAVQAFFQFVPLEDEILDFFKPVARKILELLRVMECLPTKSLGPGAETAWILPVKAITTEDPMIQELISRELLEEHLGLFYVHPEVVAFINPALRAKLGIQSLSIKHLLEIAQAVIKQAENSQDSQEESDHNLSTVKIGRNIAWIAKWLLCIHQCQSREYDSSQETLDQLAALCFFPLSDGRFVKLNEHTVFFPLSHKDQKTTQKNSGSKQPSVAFILEQDLCTINPALFTCLDKVGQSQLEMLLKSLGVKSLTPYELINHHILPTLNSPLCKEKSPELLQTYLSYIKEQLDVDPGVCQIDDVKKCALVRTNNGFVNPSVQPVHFTKAFGMDVNLQKQLPSVSWTVVRDSYLRGVGLNKVQSWRKFLFDLGVKEFFAVERRTVKVCKDSQTSPWKPELVVWPEPIDDEFVIQDFCCDEFTELVEKSQDPQELYLAAMILEKHWEEYSMYTERNVHVSDCHGNHLATTLSSFFITMTTKPWLPVFNVVSKKISLPLKVPRDVFVCSEGVLSLLEDHVKYIGPELTNDKFIHKLQIQQNVPLDMLMTELQRWGSGDSQIAPSYTSRPDFETSLDHMVSVYYFIMKELERVSEKEKQKVLERFEDFPMVFVPHDSQSSGPPGARRTGKFYLKKEICWADPSQVYLKYHAKSSVSLSVQQRQFIGLFYRDPQHIRDQHFHSQQIRGQQIQWHQIQRFFIETLHVDETPNVTEFIDLAVMVASSHSHPTKEAVQDMSFIYSVVAQKCTKTSRQDSHYAPLMRQESENEFENIIDQNMAYFVLQRLKSENDKIFPTMDDKWVSLADKPIISDDRQLEKQYQSPAVHFLRLGEPEKRLKSSTKKTFRQQQQEEQRQNQVTFFLQQVCGIKKLSECSKEEYSIDMVKFQGCFVVQSYLYKHLPLVQRYLYNKQQDLYEELENSDISAKLRQIQLGTVRNLQVVRFLSTHDRQDVSITSNCTCGLEEVNGKISLYIAESVSQNEDFQTLNEEIIKLLTRTHPDVAPELHMFLMALKNLTDQNLEKFMTKQRFKRLPEDKDIWNVPEPETPEIDEPMIEEAEEPGTSDEKTPRQERDGLACWPPRAPVSNTPNPSHPKNVTDDTVMKLWPPPAAPSNMPLTAMQHGPHPSTAVGTQHAGAERSELRQQFVDQDAPGVASATRTSATPSQGTQMQDSSRRSSVSSNTGQPNLTPGQPVMLAATNQVATNRAPAQQSPSELVCTPQGQTPPILNTDTGVSTPLYTSTPMRTLAPTLSHSVQTMDIQGLSQFAESASFLEEKEVQLIQLEELSGQYNLHWPHLMNLAENADRVEVGQWGEKLVYEFLKEKYKNNQEIELHWVNETSESKHPYDFIIMETIPPTTPGSDAKSVITYIEVKTTRTSGKHLFEISPQEFKFAVNYAESYHLYVVYNAGQSAEALRLVRAKNLVRHLKGQSIKLCLVI